MRKARTRPERFSFSTDGGSFSDDGEAASAILPLPRQLADVAGNDWVGYYPGGYGVLTQNGWQVQISGAPATGDTFTEVSHFTGSDKTEQSIWTAPVSSGAGATPTVTAKFTGVADAAITMLEYSGLSTAAGSAAVDQLATASGVTSTTATVSSGATAATGAGNELAIGFYSDSGFGDTLTAGSGWTARTNISSTGDMEILAEDQPGAVGA